MICLVVAPMIILLMKNHMHMVVKDKLIMCLWMLICLVLIYALLHMIAWWGGGTFHQLGSYLEENSQSVLT